MSFRTWTPGELSSSCAALAGAAWRLVEAQHVAATMKLTDTIEEQALLEQMIESTKPAVPIECEGLHFLLSAPFRYKPYPVGSRFRKAGMTPGIFYASDDQDTCVAELAFYRVLFYAESPQTPWPRNPGEHTAFRVALRTERAIDLRAPPFATCSDIWTQRVDYSGCQDLERQCRAAGIEIIRYQSVRDPLARANLAVLDCRAFSAREPTKLESWKLHFGPKGVRAVREFPHKTLEFRIDAFSDDPRLAGMRWER